MMLVSDRRGFLGMLSGIIVPRAGTLGCWSTAKLVRFTIDCKFALQSIVTGW